MARSTLSLVGTGGTILDAGASLRARKPRIHNVVVELALSSLPSDDNPYVDQIEGVHRVSDTQAELLLGTYDSGVPNEILELDTREARSAARDILRSEGLHLRLSSGSAIWAATRLAQRAENAEKLILTVLPESGERYLGAAIAAAPSAPHPEILPLPQPALAAQ
ncbi:hypothetical protein [Paenirhodobacter sp.]|uniref:hypothetical protein n=1 Tax=Paenirhodobacter sp. TaxID=1965326 RepID=UPI003B50C674